MQIEAKQTTDKDRLEFILRRINEGANILDLIGDYEGDDEDQYFEAARDAIDEAAWRHRVKSCTHEDEWIGGGSTPDGPIEPNAVCKHCGITMDAVED